MSHLKYIAEIYSRSEKVMDVQYHIIVSIHEFVTFLLRLTWVSSYEKSILDGITMPQ